MSGVGKVALVTGCNTGIGKETVRGLAAEGYKVYMACRDMAKCEQARDDIAAGVPNTSIHCRKCDLADLESVKTFATEFLQEENKLDVLINNAGVMWGPKLLTKQGLEMQIGVNHVGHFYLTKLLLDLLKKSAPSRIVVVSSRAHTRGQINFDDLNSEKSYAQMSAYSQSKLANVLFARELAGKLKGTGVTVNSLHPGVINTELARNTPVVNNFVVKWMLKMFLKTPAQGAATTLHVAMSPEGGEVTGKYFSDSKITRTAPQAEDDEVARKLWNATEEIIQSKLGSN